MSPPLGLISGTDIKTLPFKMWGSLYKNINNCSSYKAIVARTIKIKAKCVVLLLLHDGGGGGRSSSSWWWWWHGIEKTMAVPSSPTFSSRERHKVESSHVSKNRDRNAASHTQWTFLERHRAGRSSRRLTWKRRREKRESTKINFER